MVKSPGRLTENCAGRQGFSRAEKTYLAAAIALAIFALLPALITPVVLSAAASELRISDTTLSKVMASTAAFSTLAGISFGIFVTRVNRVHFAVGGTVLLCAANLAMALFPSFPVLVAVLHVGAIGGCIVGGIAWGYLGHFKDPKRAFGLFTICAVLVQAAGTAAVPLLHKELGFSAVFLFPITLLPVALFALRFLPARPGDSAAPRQPVAEAKSPAAQGGLGYAATSASVAAWVLWKVYVVAVFTFSARIGESLGVDAKAVGSSLALATLLSLGGAAAATALGDRMGRAAPLMLGTFLACASCILLIVAEKYLSFLVAITIFNFAWSFNNIYYFGMVAAADPKGRMAVMLNAITGLTGSATLGAMGVLSTKAGIEPTVTAPAFSLVGASLALVLALLALRRARHAS